MTRLNLRKINVSLARVVGCFDRFLMLGIILICRISFWWTS